MDRSFRISSEERNDCMYIDLEGNFDGSSAYELMHYIRDKCKRVRQARIHTNKLRQIHPFGCRLFNKYLYLIPDMKRIQSILFTGKKANHFNSGH